MPCLGQVHGKVSIPIPHHSSVQFPPGHVIFPSLFPCSHINIVDDSLQPYQPYKQVYHISKHFSIFPCLIWWAIIYCQKHIEKGAKESSQNGISKLFSFPFFTSITFLGPQIRNLIPASLPQTMFLRWGSVPLVWLRTLS